jgi:hypothetical protein
MVLLVATFLSAASIGPAALCVPGTLAIYILLPPAGCTIAGNVKVTDFEFDVVAVSEPVPAASDIFVTPVVGPGNRYGLKFSSSAFSVAGADFATFEVRYIFDPADIRSLEDIMTASSPVAPGLARVDTFGCLGSGYVPSCPGAEVHLIVFHNGISFVDTDQQSIAPPQSILGIRNVINLQANGAFADFDSIENAVYLPEPGSWATVLAALAAVLVFRRRFQISRGTATRAAAVPRPPLLAWGAQCEMSAARLVMRRRDHSRRWRSSSKRPPKGEGFGVPRT